MTEALLEVRGLKAYYRSLHGNVRAVDGVDLTVRAGEVFGIAGESGCGKSTLTKAILRLLKEPGYIAEGSVSFGGTDILTVGAEALRRLRGSSFSYVPQSSMNALNPVMRIRDQIGDALDAHRKASAEETRRKAAELLGTVGLPERAARMFPHELSGGMKQRAVIAIAIALGPRLIVADEPTTALDVVTQRGILQALGDIKSALGASIVLISHDLAVHAEIVDTLLVMYAGKVAETGGVYELFEKPLHPYSQVLVAAIPSIEERREIKGLAGRPPSLLAPPAGCRFQPRCPKAMPVCSNREPALREIEPGRQAACFLYGE
jgi:oligopeptide/dipeptide ABC transporter ATP-binding protein